MENWLKTAIVPVTAIRDDLGQDEEQVINVIREYQLLIDRIKEKENSLVNLSNNCDKLKGHSDVHNLAVMLSEQLIMIRELFRQQLSIITTNISIFESHLQRLQEQPASIQSATDDTLDSAPMPEDEVAVETVRSAETIKSVEVKAAQPLAFVHIETQTSENLEKKQPIEVVAEAKPQPIDEEQQTSFPLDEKTVVDTLDHSMQTIQEKKPTENITVTQTYSQDGHETIKFESGPNQTVSEVTEDVFVDAKYQQIPPGETHRSSELLLRNVPQSFETTFVEPDDTTTEVIVDADGTKRIIVTKLTRTRQQVVQQHQQQQFTTVSTLIGADMVPITQSVSQINLENQRSTNTISESDGGTKTVISQQGKGSYVAGTSSDSVVVHEFESEPTVEEYKTSGTKVGLGSTEYQTGDPSEIGYEQSSIRAVVHQVTRRIIKRTRKIIKRVVIIDGVEHITEEIVEEPEEIEITEEEAPHVNVNITRTFSGQTTYEERNPTVTTCDGVESVLTKIVSEISTEPVIEEPAETIDNEADDRDTVVSQVFEIIPAPVELVIVHPAPVDVIQPPQLLPEGTVKPSVEKEEEEVKLTSEIVVQEPTEPADHRLEPIENKISTTTTHSSVQDFEPITTAPVEIELFTETEPIIKTEVQQIIESQPIVETEEIIEPITSDNESIAAEEKPKLIPSEPEFEPSKLEQPHFEHEPEKSEQAAVEPESPLSEQAGVELEPTSEQADIEPDVISLEKSEGKPSEETKLTQEQISPVPEITNIDVIWPHKHHLEDPGLEISPRSDKTVHISTSPPSKEESFSVDEIWPKDLDTGVAFDIQHYEFESKFIPPEIEEQVEPEEVPVIIEAIDHTRLPAEVVIDHETFTVTSEIPVITETSVSTESPAVDELKIVSKKPVPTPRSDIVESVPRLDARTVTALFLENETLKADPTTQTIKLSMPSHGSQSPGTLTVTMKMEQSESPKINVNLTEECLVGLSEPEAIVGEAEYDVTSKSEDSKNNRKKKKRKDKESVSSPAEPEVNIVEPENAASESRTAVQISPDGDKATSLKDDSIDPSVVESVELNIEDDNTISEQMEMPEFVETPIQAITPNIAESNEPIIADVPVVKEDSIAEDSIKQQISEKLPSLKEILPEVISEDIVLQEQEAKITPDESYHSISCDEGNPVKIVEESVISSESDSPKPIVSEIVISKSVLEGVYTDEAEQQTSPTKQLTEPTDEEPSSTVALASLDVRSTQTSPEIKEMSLNISLQTSPEPIVEQHEQEIQTTVVESCEIEIQTTPEPVIEGDKSNVEVVSEEAQTDDIIIAEEMKETILVRETVDNSNQTTEILTKEQELQTSPRDSPQKEQNLDVKIPTEDIVVPLALQIGADIVKNIPIEIERTTEGTNTEVFDTTEIDTQTSLPHSVRDEEELSPRSIVSSITSTTTTTATTTTTSSEEPYEIQIEATITLPEGDDNAPMVVEVNKSFVIDSSGEAKEVLSGQESEKESEKQEEVEPDLKSDKKKKKKNKKNKKEVIDANIAFSNAEKNSMDESNSIITPKQEQDIILQTSVENQPQVTQIFLETEQHYNAPVDDSVDIAKIEDSTLVIETFAVKNTQVEKPIEEVSQITEEQLEYSTKDDILLATNQTETKTVTVETSTTVTAIGALSTGDTDQKEDTKAISTEPETESVTLMNEMVIVKDENPSIVAENIRPLEQSPISELRKHESVDEFVIEEAVVQETVSIDEDSTTEKIADIVRSIATESFPEDIEPLPQSTDVDHKSTTQSFLEGEQYYKPAPDPDVMISIQKDEVLEEVKDTITDTAVLEPTHLLLKELDTLEQLEVPNVEIAIESVANVETAEQPILSESQIRESPDLFIENISLQKDGSSEDSSSQIQEVKEAFQAPTLEEPMQQVSTDIDTLVLTEDTIQPPEEEDIPGPTAPESHLSEALIPDESKIETKPEPAKRVELTITTTQQIFEPNITSVTENPLKSSDKATDQLIELTDNDLIVSTETEPISPGTISHEIIPIEDTVSLPTTKPNLVHLTISKKTVSNIVTMQSPSNPETAPSEDKPTLAQIKIRKNKPTSSVTIEEALSPTEELVVPLTPGLDLASEYERAPNTIWSQTILQSSNRAPATSEDIIRSESDYIYPTSELRQPANLQWVSASDTISDRIRNINTIRSTHLSNVLHLATLSEVVTEEPIENRIIALQSNIDQLQDAIENRDTVITQRTVIMIIETVSTWLETIEYRVYSIRQQSSDGPSEQKVKAYTDLNTELQHIAVNVDRVADDLTTAEEFVEPTEIERMNTCFESLQSQVQAVEEITKENEKQAMEDLCRWNEYVLFVEHVIMYITNLQERFDFILNEDISIDEKLQLLDELETSNREQGKEISRLLNSARVLIRDFPGKEIPQDIYVAYESSRNLENAIFMERSRLMQLQALAEEYEQTLNEFVQITLLADHLVEKPIIASTLEQLQQEMQKHRKFFVNLSHCRSILESLEENLDKETRLKHADLHKQLHNRASSILEKASERAQKISLAASRWTVLEKGMREERQWLQVAQQRVPDLSAVTSADYDRYITMYQSLNSDISTHHAKLLQLTAVAGRLQELVKAPNLEEENNDSLTVLLRLKEEVNLYLRRLITFRDTWTIYELQSDKLEAWIKEAERDISRIQLSDDMRTQPIENMRQFWEVKVHYEVHNNIRTNVGNNFEQALQILPLADETLQRQFHNQLEARWLNLSEKINGIQSAIVNSISAQDIPINEKLALLERELQELQLNITSAKGVIKNEDELNLYIERMQVLKSRIDIIGNELGRIGMLPSTEPERVGELFALSHRVSTQIAEELEGASMLKDRLIVIQQGIGRIRKHQQLDAALLDECESHEKQGSEQIEKALVDCQNVSEDLIGQWQEIMRLRQLLHTLPMRLRVSVSPVKLERDISQLQDDHAVLESRCANILSMLKNRLVLWRRFERQLEMVQQSVQETDYMMELLKVNGHIDYERLKKATERLEVSDSKLCTCIPKSNIILTYSCLSFSYLRSIPKFQIR